MVNLLFLFMSRVDLDYPIAHTRQDKHLVVFFLPKLGRENFHDRFFIYKTQKVIISKIDIICLIKMSIQLFIEIRQTLYARNEISRR